MGKLNLNQLENLSTTALSQVKAQLIHILMMGDNSAFKHIKKIDQIIKSRGNK